MEIGASMAFGWASPSYGTDTNMQSAAMSAAAASPANGPAAAAVLGSSPAAADGNGVSAAVAADRAIADLMNATGPRKVDMECQTCASRRYQDGSDDPGVSFKAPTKIDPSLSASTVLGHENEHVMRNQAKAQAEGARVVSQSVVLHGDTCPECGRFYIAGGTTTTTTKSGGEQSQPPAQQNTAGEMLNALA